MTMIPSNRPRSRFGRRWRPLVGLAAAGLILASASGALAAGPVIGSGSVTASQHGGGSRTIRMTRSTWTDAAHAALADRGPGARVARPAPFRSIGASLTRTPSRHRPAGAPLSPTRRASVGASSGAVALLVVGPTAQIVTAYDGISQAEAGPIEPPDPWVQASPSYVIATTNGRVRVSNRQGGTVQSVPTWALFGVPAGQNESDPRILWDTVHQRWVGVSMSFDDFFTQDFLYVIVSESASPLGAWDHIVFDSGNVLPDFPGIATSSDKIVIGTDAFDELGAFMGAQIDEIAWSQVLSGGDVDFDFSEPDPAVVHPRPAQVIGSSSDVHLVAEDTSQGDLLYRRLTGPATTVATGIGQYADLNGDPNLTNGPFALPPPPNQPGSPATIVMAVDERPTDAVWRAGTLWLVATYPHDFGLGALDTVRVVRLSTASGPAVTFDGLVGTAGLDTYMGGVGVLADGTAVISYEVSSPTLPIRAAVTTYSDSAGMGPELVLGDSDGTYAGVRWGDFQAVAADPLGGESAWVVGETSAADGTWRTHVARLTYDATAPSAPGIPTAVVLAPGTLSASVPVRLSWAAAVDAGSGIDAYAVETSRDGGAYGLPSTTSSTSLIDTLLIGDSERCRVQATDGAGNTGPFATGSTVIASLREQTSGTTYTGSWATSINSTYSGGSARHATSAGATATFLFYGRSVGFVAYKGPTRGSVKVYVDNVYKGTVNLYSATGHARQIVYATGWSSIGTHRIKLVVVGTHGHPRVDVDAFVVLS